MGPFGEYLKQVLKSHGMTVYALCKKLKKSTGYISNVINERPIPGGKLGSRYKPPMHEMDRWADAIGLNNDERQKLKALADVAQMPPAMQHAFLMTQYAVLLHTPETAIEVIQRSTDSKDNRAARIEFGRFVDALLDQRQLSRADFAAMVGITLGEINGILDENPKPSMRKDPPLKNMYEWASKLQLDTASTDRLHELAELVHTPVVIYNRYLSMRKQLPPAACTAQPSAKDDATQELDRIMNPDEQPRQPAPTYPRPAPIRGGSHG